jgi:Domain of unknown function (DUF5615)
LALLYADENFPAPTVEALRRLGHDVLTAREAGQADAGIPDVDVLAFAHARGRAVLTRLAGASCCPGREATRGLGVHPTRTPDATSDDSLSWFHHRDNNLSGHPTPRSATHHQGLPDNGLLFADPTCQTEQEAKKAEGSWSLRCPMVFPKPFVHYLAAAAPAFQFLTIRELSQSEFDLYVSHCETIIRHYHDYQIYLYVRLNYHSVIKLLEGLGRQCTENVGKAPNMMGSEKMVLNVNRKLLNFLAGVRTFVDHTERNLERRYGLCSERYTSFKAATAAAFDRSFSYRLLWHLRNYVQHCGMPVGNMSIHIDFDEESGQPISQSLEFSFSRDALLANYDKWHKKVRPDLESMPDHFPIRPHVDAVMEHIESLQMQLLVADLPTVLDSLCWLDKLMLEVTWRGGKPTVARRRPSNEDPDSDVIECKDFPVEMMEMLRRPMLKHFGFGTSQFFA